MLFILLAWVYISFICWTWGCLLLRLFRGSTAGEAVVNQFPIVCFTGMAFLGVIVLWLSFFIPLGGCTAHLIIVIPALFSFLRKDIRITCLHQLASLKKSYRPVTLFFLFSMILLMVIMNALTIIHPDTLGYHAQTIKWNEEYKVVPGLVHLETRLGYQGLWYLLLALFSFRFTGTSALTFINGAVICWFVLFMTEQVSKYVSTTTEHK